MSFKSGAFIAVITAIAVIQIPKLFQPNLQPTYGGHVEPGFENIAELFRKNIESGKEMGSSFAAFYKGRLVVNLWGGYADDEFRIPWSEDTIGNFYSTTKAMGAIMIGILVDRGLIDYEETVATYWPEFAQNGKKYIKVKELLSHQAGLAAIDVPFNISLIQDDPHKLGDILAQQKPLWIPGTRYGYHALTFGLYVDQLIRRVDPLRRSAKQFFADEIASPFNVDFFIGKPLQEHYRAARQSDKLAGLVRTVTEGSVSQLLWSLSFLVHMPELLTKAMFNPSGLEVNSVESHSYGIISSNGFGTAEAVAKVFGILADGGKSIDDKRLLSETVVDRLNTIETQPGTDKVLGMKGFSFGPGTMILPPLLGMNETVFGHYGVGCQAGFADVKRKIGWAYTTNYLSGILDIRHEQRYAGLVKELYNSVSALDDD